MSKSKWILAALSLTAIVVPLGYYVSFVGSTEALCQQFPDIDPQLVYRAHKEIFWETIKGQHSDVEDDADGSTGEYNRIFLEKIASYTK